MKLTDWEVFQKLEDARKEFYFWEEEYKKRKMNKKPFVRWSIQPKNVKDARRR